MNLSNDIPGAPPAETNENPPTRGEIRQAMKSMKHGKPPGVDEITRC